MACEGLRVGHLFVISVISAAREVVTAGRGWEVVFRVGSTFPHFQASILNASNHLLRHQSDITGRRAATTQTFQRSEALSVVATDVWSSATSPSHES